MQGPIYFLTLSPPRASLWRVKSSGVRQSKIYKWPLVVKGLKENTSLVKFIQNYIWDSRGVFCNLTSDDINDLTDIKFVYISCSLIRWCKIETSLGLPQKSSVEIFVHLLKFSENVQQHSYDLLTKFWRIFGNLRKVVENLRKIIENAVISMAI